MGRGVAASSRAIGLLDFCARRFYLEVESQIGDDHRDETLAIVSVDSRSGL